jgi:hypothetical protein
LAVDGVFGRDVGGRRGLLTHAAGGGERTLELAHAVGVGVESGAVGGGELGAAGVEIEQRGVEHALSPQRKPRRCCGAGVDVTAEELLEGARRIIDRVFGVPRRRVNHAIGRVQVVALVAELHRAKRGGRCQSRGDGLIDRGAGTPAEALIVIVPAEQRARGVDG